MVSLAPALRRLGFRASVVIRPAPVTQAAILLPTICAIEARDRGELGLMVSWAECQDVIARAVAEQRGLE